MVNTTCGNIILDCQIKTCNDWVAIVKFLCEFNNKMAQSADALPMKNINNLHIELGHPSKTITLTTAKALGIQVTSMFKPCEDCTLGNAKQCAVSKKALPCSKVLGERLLFDISCPSTLTFGGKWHWLLIVDDSSDYIWRFFKKEKSNLAAAMANLMKILKN